MTQSKVTAVGIAGITGKFGSLVLDSLLEVPNVQIRGYCRNASKLASTYSDSPRLSIVEGEATDVVKLSKFAQGLDVLVCTYLGDKELMIDGQKALIDACDKAHVPRYIASDYTFDHTKLQLGQHPIKDPMKIVYEYVKTKDHVEGVHVLIGALMETFWSAYLQVWDPEQKALVYWGSGEETWESTTYEDAAKYTAAVAIDNSAVGLQRFLGDKKSTQEIARAFENVYGFEPKLQRQGSLDDLYERMHYLLQKDPANVIAWLGLFYQYYLLNGQTSIADELVNQKYPHVQPVTFQAFLNNHTIGELSSSMADLGKRS